MTSDVKRQTIKQAKKSFKARGQPSLSERDLKQLQRARELDQRAWKAKEQEKRRAEANRKRAEKEREDRQERERAQLGSQRRCDRFGYQSSQFHLGKFFKIGAESATIDPKEALSESEPEPADDTMEDEFFEEDLDDVTILNALKDSDAQIEPQANFGVSLQPDVPTTAPPAIPPDRLTSAGSHVAQQVPPAPPKSIVLPRPKISIEPRIIEPQRDPSVEEEEEDFGSFWDELDSSSQLARDLDTPRLTTAKTTPSRSSSFGWDDLDLTEEDLERLDPPTPVHRASNDRMLMPPPPPPPPRLPEKRNLCITKSATPVVPDPRSTPIPSKPVKVLCQNHWTLGSINHDFTASELESWVDDDLILTQIAPD